LGPGCSFAPRCEIRTAGCDLSAPELLSVGDGRLIRCHAYDN